jgi:hypothetical protein
MFAATGACSCKLKQQLLAAVDLLLMYCCCSLMAYAEAS